MGTLSAFAGPARLAVASVGALRDGRRGRRRALLSAAADEVHAHAVAPLPALVLSAAAIGAATTAALRAMLRPNGAGAHLSSVSGYTLVREVIPPLVALVLIARAGPAIVARLAGARGKRTPLRARAALSPILGLAAAAPALTAVLSVAALFGGAFAGRLSAVRMLGAVTPASVAVALAKAALFGLVVAAVHGAHGLDADRLPVGLARAGSRGAIHAAFACLLLDGVISFSPLAGVP